MSTRSEVKFVDAAFLEARYSNHRSAFGRWIKNDGFPAPRFLGHKRVWILSEVEAWEARGLKSGPSANVRNLIPNRSAQ